MHPQRVLPPRPGSVLLLLLGILVCANGSCAQDRAAVTPTRVVLFLIDDLGWADLGCYGSDYYRTPHIDRLAAEGVRFTDAYAACNVCSPSRAAILTGKYPARLLLTQWLPGGRWDREGHAMREGRCLGNLPLEEVTIAEALREAGYATGYIGKWHLGPLPYYYPEHQGFDVNVAGRDYGSPGSYFYPYEGNWKIPTTGQDLVREDLLPGRDGDYLVDRLAEEAERFLRDRASEPFFLMLSHYAVHTPLQGKPEKVQKYAEIPKGDRQGKPAYAAMVESVDESVGRVMRTLRDLGIDEHTLVIFTSDNGGFARATSNAPMRANKGSNYEGGLRVPFVVRWPGRARAGAVSEVPVCGTDIYPTLLAATRQEPRPHQHADGESLVPLLTGRGDLERDALFWHYPHYNRHPQSFPASVVRAGRWKLIENLETGELALYDLVEDLGETVNLAARHPGRTEELHRRLQAWRQAVRAEPMVPNPEFREKR